MRQRVVSLIIIGLLSLGCQGICSGADSEETRRIQALRLYQEGLFQETGTGDLEVAFKTYQELALNYHDLPDVAAVAYFHMGLVLDKLGQEEEARVYFKLVKEKYPKQKTVIERIDIKIGEYESQKSVVQRIKPEIARESDKRRSQPDNKTIAGIQPEPGKRAKPISLARGETKPKPLPAPTRSQLRRMRAKTPRLPDRFGFGLHNLGGHIQYRYSNNKGIEGNFQNHLNRWYVGGRFYHFVNELNNIQPYFGFLINYMIKEQEESSLKAGVFIGGGYKIMPALTLSVDISMDGGYSFQNQTSKAAESRLAGRLALTFYLE